MTIELTFEELEAEIQRQGANLVFDGDLRLYMTELPIGIKYITIRNGDLRADKLTSLPNDIFISCQSARLYNIISIGNEVSIMSNFKVNLKHLTTIGNNVRIVSKQGVLYDFADTGLTEINLTDDNTIPDDVVHFLIEHDICLKVPETSSLVNLAFDGVRVEISN